MSEQVLDQILQEMRQGFAAVNSRLDRVDERLDALEGRMDALEGRMDALEGRIDALESGQVGLRQAVVELQESVNRIESVQQQQSEAIASLRKERSIDRRMLEALTVKYIEHEAEIRALKQA